MVFAGGGGISWSEFQGMALNGLFCADLLRPPDLVPLTDFTYKYRPVSITARQSYDVRTFILDFATSF